MIDTPNLIEQMQSQVQAWQASDDDRAIFLQCYLMMTRNMMVAIDTGDFEDGPWVSVLTHGFAAYYFNAIKHHEDLIASPVWAYAFEVAGRKDAHVLQNLLLGVNAHICYDLIFALADCIQDEWDMLSNEQREARRRDFFHVNDIIGATLDAVQDQVVEEHSRLMRVVDDVFGRLDEWTIKILINRWRHQVWEQSVAYLIAAPEQKTHLKKVYTANAEQRAKAIRGQRGLIGIVDLF
ncbi:hypothetical protein G4Y79_03775 [Phototrophicus methaneseepsis]|uniref:Uncharacterized protein n=1 Tax=Phototrophicus methaneseepsis TaxID=2710758 RepID=A0A7S8EB14_9CHLR|nr:DUF5995 family protein [Phototrophicus methaneseepsis]QPC83513.1 hypothetical protein G4Y79_03775 [Phototrophicus methaneseepsis]